MLGHYLMFNGDCEEALNVYQQAFNGKIINLQHYGDMPSDPNFPIKEEERGLVLNSSLAIGDEVIMCADSSRGATSGENMYISVGMEDLDLMQKAWDILKADGYVYMELAPAFFAELHGSLRDRFGINWMFTGGVRV